MEDNADTQVTINKPGRVLHFSDGVDEEIVEEVATELASEPQETNVDPVSKQCIALLLPSAQVRPWRNSFLIISMTI